MSTAPPRSTPGSIFTSSLTVLAALGAVAALGAPPALAQGRSLGELELPLARGGDLYLVIDEDRERLEIRIRGAALETLPIIGFDLVAYRAPGQPPAEPITLPARWTVTRGVRIERQLIAPPVLTEKPEAVSDAGPLPVAGPPELPPTAYTVRLEEGWMLRVGPDPIDGGLWARLGDRWRDGWARLRGRERPRPALLALRLAPEEAQRLHHLLGTGLPILVAAPPP